jgi:hypothetical protein
MKLQNSICLCRPGALDLFENHRAFRPPAVRGGLEVVVRQMNVDGCDQLADAGKAALADNVVGQLAEETFDKIEPRRAGGSEVKVNSRVLFEPSENNGMLVGGVVVDDQMKVQFGRRLTVDFLQECEPLDMGMLLSGRAQNFAIEVVQRRKERNGTMADVVMSAGPDMTDAQRQIRLRALKRLALAFSSQQSTSARAGGLR